jgi:hypothetical protein
MVTGADRIMLEMPYVQRRPMLSVLPIPHQADGLDDSVT